MAAELHEHHDHGRSAWSRRPAAVRRVVTLVYSMLGLLAIGTVCSYLFHDSLVLAWAKGNEAAQTILREGGIEALERSSIHVPGFSALALTSCVTYAMLAWVLVSFLLGHHQWARWSLMVMMAFTAFVAVIGALQPWPIQFLVISVVGIGIALVTIFLLSRRELSDYLRLP